MPKVFKKDGAIYQTEVAKLATAQVQLDSEKYRFQSLEAELKKDRIVFNIMVILGILGICATVWSALK